MTRAFVTGAAGFAGSYLTEHLLARGREVVGLVLDRGDVHNLAQALAGEHAAALHLVEGDLCDERVLSDAVRDPVRTIYSGDGWKLTCSPAGQHELFDLKADPDELTNLYGEAEHRERVGSMWRALLDWQRRTGDTVFLPRP